MINSGKDVLNRQKLGEIVFYNYECKAQERFHGVISLQVAIKTMTKETQPARDKTGRNQFLQCVQRKKKYLKKTDKKQLEQEKQKGVTPKDTKKGLQSQVRPKGQAR